MKKVKFNVLLASFLAIAFVFSAVAQPVPVLAEDNTSGLNDSIVLYVGNPKALVNGKTTPIDTNASVVPYIANSRTLVPTSFIASQFGFQVEWNAKTKEATLKKDAVVLKFTVNSNIMVQNGKNVTMETKAVSLNNRIMVPIAYVASGLDLKLTYDRGVIILNKTKSFDTVKDKELINSAIAMLSGLPIVGSVENFNKLLAKFSSAENGFSGEVSATTSPTGSVTMDIAESEAALSNEVAMEKSTDYSTTNTQVQGVDEADIVKTDGENIYHMTYQSLNITKVVPTGDMKLLSKIIFADLIENFSPQEIYVDGDFVSVIGSCWMQTVNSSSDTGNKSVDGVAVPEIASDMIAGKMIVNGKNLTTVLVFDVSDIENPELVRDFSIEGSMVSSRKIGDILYLVTSKYLYYYGLGVEIEIPMYYDTMNGVKGTKLECGTMQYFPNEESNCLTMISGINVKENDIIPEITTVLGNADQIYMSTTALYITKYNYQYRTYIVNDLYDDTSDGTSIYKFTLDNGKAYSTGTGNVKGSVLNQFSMDEQDGFFRIATTTDDWQSPENSMYVLDSSMKVVGKIEDIAPGERIYSVRYMGERAFVVTFKQVDPLFAIDLSDPYNPTVLGELKIPGYSTYLHPYDENHLIGFGYNTDDYTTYDSKGNIVEVRTVNSGLKLSMFDITNMNNPIEVDSEVIGTQTMQSDLIYNHKAMLFSKEKGFFAFQYVDYDYGTFDENGKQNDPNPSQGVFVYDASENGFELRGNITQMEEGDKSKYNDLDYEKFIQRLIYIDNVFYSVSNKAVYANDMNTLEFINKVVY